MDILARYEHWPDLMTLGVVAVAGAQLYGGYSAQQQGKESEAMADYNAKLEQSQAKQILATTTIKQDREAEAADRQLSSMAAQAGASGAVSTVGAPLLAQAKQASEAELDNLMIGYEGQIGASQARSQAEMDKMMGREYAQVGKDRFIGSALAAGGTLLQGFARPNMAKTDNELLIKKKKAATQYSNSSDPMGGWSGDPTYGSIS